MLLLNKNSPAIPSFEGVWQGNADVNYKYIDFNGYLFDEKNYKAVPVVIIFSTPFPLLEKNPFALEIYTNPALGIVNYPGLFNIDSFINIAIDPYTTIQWQYWSFQKNINGFKGSLTSRISGIPTAIDKSTNSMSLYTLNYLTSKVMKSGATMSANINGQSISITVKGELDYIVTGTVLFTIELQALKE